MVESLAKWRFRPGKKDGKAIPSSVILNVPVRVAMTAAFERSLRRQWAPATREIADDLKDGEALNGTDLAGLERVLAADPASVKARAELLAYASTKGWIADPNNARKERAEQIGWLVQNQPKASVLGSPMATISCSGPRADPAACHQVAALWAALLASKPLDEIILEHASNSLRIIDPAKAEAALRPLVGKVDMAGIWLGDLYGLAALGVTGIDPETGLASAAEKSVPGGPFAQHARFALSHAGDIHLVFSGLSAIVTSGWSLAQSGQPPDGYLDLCHAVLKHAQELDPGSIARCSTSADNPIVVDVAMAQRTRFGKNIQGAHLIKRSIPVYPLAAKARGIEGVVRFNAVIDTQGKVTSLMLLSGPFVLYPPARDAILRWEYSPTQINGTAVEVTTHLDVTFQLR